MLIRIVALLATVILVTASGCWAAAGKDSIQNIDDGLALKGYDPVSYHSEGPVKGKETLSLSYGGATYRFASTENLEAFNKSPDRFLPAYGGWCAWAMLDGEKVDVDPRTYKVIDGRTYLFYNSFFVNTLKKWNERANENGEAAMVDQADGAWNTLAAPPS